MTGYTVENRGALFKNHEKSKDTDRDYSGMLNVNGVEFYISGWLKTSKKGTKFLSLSVKPKDEPEARRPELNDSIGF